MENSILFGNGINRLTRSNISWDSILDTIKGTRKFDNDDLPNTMIYERILMERQDWKENVLQEEFTIKAEISAKMTEIYRHPLYLELGKLQFHNYLTTNYDYAFRNTLHIDYDLPYENLGTEDTYSVRRKVQIKTSGNENLFKIWHIHGEIDQPRTIMLGLDHYCGAIGKIDSYIKGNYEYEEKKQKIKLKSIKEKLLNNQFDNISWVELFFTSNIHILGLSFDYSEIDLWWILNKRARMLRDSEINFRIKNKIFIYCYEMEKSKIELLNSFNVKVEIVPKNNNLNNWEEYYNKILEIIRSRK